MGCCDQVVGIRLEDLHDGMFKCPTSTEQCATKLHSVALHVNATLRALNNATGTTPYLLGGHMPNEGLKELYTDELKDLYNAENQLVKALPKMAKAASSDELRQGFEEHLEQTKEHVQRLEKIFKAMDKSPKGKKCMGMEGLIKEGSEVMEEDFEDAVLDVALIGAAQRVEHYEIAAYGTVCALANVLGETGHASLLQKTLDEEKVTNEKLTELATEINAQANEGGAGTAQRTQKGSRRVA
jgi:ferritin-like metal-binding protein YciE